MTTSIYPCLWFGKNAKAACEWYYSSLPYSHMIATNEYAAKAKIIECENQTKIDYDWNSITLKGIESQSSWCKDQFRVSWQIHPENLGEIVKQNSHAQATLFKMKKLLIDDLIHA